MEPRPPDANEDRKVPQEVSGPADAALDKGLTGHEAPDLDKDAAIAEEPVLDRSPVKIPGALWVVLLSMSAALASLIQVALKRPDEGVFVLTLTFAICGAAVFLDVATRSIPNALTYPAILLGLVINLCVTPGLALMEAHTAVRWLGSPGATGALVGFGVCTVFAMISFAMRGLGGGDAKLVMAIGALLGLSQATAVLFHALLIAAAIGLINWAARGTLIPRLQVVTQNVLSALFTDTRFRDAYPFAKSEAPFALSIFLGLILAQFIRLHSTLMDTLSDIG